MTKSLLLTAAQTAAELIKTNFRSAQTIDTKTSHRDIVTPTDKQSQKLIREALLAGMAQAGIAVDSIGFIGEENAPAIGGVDAGANHQHVFIIDPLDGTTNFAAGIPFFCISIAYAHRQQVTLGLVMDPLSGDVFWAERGKGAFVEREGRSTQLHLQSLALKQAVVAAHLNGTQVIYEHQFAWYLQLYPQVRGIRNLGSLTWDLCLLAENTLQGVFNQGCFIWDVAAAQLIVEEAGGGLYDLNQAPLTYDWTHPKQGLQLVACHPELKASFFAAQPSL